jgi:hypothetical protein
LNAGGGALLMDGYVSITMTKNFLASRNLFSLNFSLTRAMYFVHRLHYARDLIFGAIMTSSFFSEVSTATKKVLPWHMILHGRGMAQRISVIEATTMASRESKTNRFIVSATVRGKRNK